MGFGVQVVSVWWQGFGNIDSAFLAGQLEYFLVLEALFVNV